MRKKAIGDYRMCIQEAKMFQTAANLCRRNAKLPRFRDGVYSVVVNAALACELYLKGIMIYYSEDKTFCTGHDLKELFVSLPANVQIEIKKIFQNIEGLDFEESISMNRMAFQEWRYAFEKDVDIIVNPMALICFMYCLEEYVDSLKGVA